jgi:hypothetical protein
MIHKLKPKEVAMMTGRNNKPEEDGVKSNPGRLDQYGDELSSENEEEFQSAVDENCREQVDNKE